MARPPLSADAWARGHPRPGFTALAGRKLEKPGLRWQPQRGAAAAGANSRGPGDSAPETPPAGSAGAPQSGRCPHPGRSGRWEGSPATPGASESANPEAWWPCRSRGDPQAQQHTGAEDGVWEKSRRPADERRAALRPRRPSRQLLTLPVLQPGQRRATPATGPAAWRFNVPGALRSLGPLRRTHGHARPPGAAGAGQPAHARAHPCTHKTHARGYTHTRKGASTHTCTCTCSGTHTHTHTQKHTHTCTHTRSGTCTCVHTNGNTCAHTYMYTHRHTCARSGTHATLAHRRAASGSPQHSPLWGVKAEERPAALPPVLALGANTGQRPDGQDPPGA